MARKCRISTNTNAGMTFSGTPGAFRSDSTSNPVIRENPKSQVISGYCLVPKESTEYKIYNTVFIDYLYILCAMMTGILTGMPHETA